MRIQACVPCAKRKVRCDKGEPCSNCKRRKHDHCNYPEISATERVQELEAQVRELGGAPKSADAPVIFHMESGIRDPQSRTQRDGVEFHPDYPFKSSCRPVVTNANYELAYRESGVWPNLIKDGSNTEGAVKISHAEGESSFPTSAPEAPSAFASIFSCNASFDFSESHPKPFHAKSLWEKFFERVNPITKISFTQEWSRVQAASLQPSLLQDFCVEEHALLFAVFYVSVKSFSARECMETFGSSSSAVLKQYQLLCEKALIASNFFRSTDLRILEAIAFYLVSLNTDGRTNTDMLKIAGFERVDTKSLWSLLGIVLRNAERIGLHRDGQVLGLSPYDTERRRRLWWQLQHLDLVMGVRFGSTSLTLGAEWDVKLPLSIDDEDLNPHTQDYTPERETSTDISFCLWTYWIIAKQRAIGAAHNRLSWLSWTMSDYLTTDMKNEIVRGIESEANMIFIQHCDPAKPLDAMTQLSVRAVICQMRCSILHSQVVGKSMTQLSEQHRTALLEECKRSVEYDIATHSNQLISHFRWRTTFYFPWSRFVYVLAEACQPSITKRTEETWRLLTRLYDANSDLLNMSGDRRNAYAAELLIGAWRARAKLLTRQDHNQQGSLIQLEKPDFVQRLESLLLQNQREANPHKHKKIEYVIDAKQMPRPYITFDLPTALEGNISPSKAQPPPSSTEADIDVIRVPDTIDFTFDDIDWSFWCDLNHPE